MAPSRRKPFGKQGSTQEVPSEDLPAFPSFRRSISERFQNGGGIFHAFPERYVRNTFGRGSLGIIGRIAALGMVCLGWFYFGLFMILTPLTYGIGGSVLYRDQGWKTFQPGIGGPRFVCFNAVGWTLYGVSVMLMLVNMWLADSMISSLVFANGLSSYTLVVSGLFTYSNLKPKFLGVTTPVDTANLTKVFNAEIQLSKLMISSGGQTPSNFWYAFIGMQVLLSFCGLWINAGFFYSDNAVLKILANVFTMSSAAVAVFVTHAMGGKWKHITCTYYAMWQPFKGGQRYCLLQAMGWNMFGGAMLVGLLLFTSQVREFFQGGSFVPEKAMLLVGILGVAAEVSITASLFVYQAQKATAKETYVKFHGKSAAVRLWLKCLTKLFSDPGVQERDIAFDSPEDYMKGEERFQEMVKNVQTTGDQYLIIGCGFLGSRLVNRLLERGESKIRIFDISPRNPFPGDDRVEYIQGDVTKPSSIGAACQGVDTVYATFAIIRHMDRLEHQAALSYTINVVGTEHVIEACQENNIKRIVVTSSGHCTTDEHSQPRIGRDEKAPYVLRETAHNHYGWTKAIADKFCLESNGATTKDGGSLKISVVRPCSGIFSGDDRLCVERMLTMGYYLSCFGSTCVMDWIYVENVVLGHLLLEDALQKGKDVGGEAYCVTNDEPVSMYGFWTSLTQQVQRLEVPLSFDFVWVPDWPFWLMSYMSEWNQRLFKGKASLGNDLDFLSPATMITSGMTNTYKMDKARKDLGYEPAWSLDEALQQSVIEFVRKHKIGQARERSKTI